MRSLIRKARLLAKMTQVQAAEAVGVSQPTYQRWESGTGSVPKSKVAKLAKVLSITPRQVAGQPEPFDLLGVNPQIADDRQYYGELAIHFCSGSPPLLLPISEAQRSEFFDGAQRDDGFILVESLDNRTVFVRCRAIADVYFSSDAYGDYGPENYGAQHLGVRPDEGFWKVIEHLECSEILEDEFSEQEIQSVMRRFYFDDAELNGLIESGRIKAEDGEKVKQEAAETAALYASRARDITWQLPGNRRRYVSWFENKEIYEALSILTMADEQEFLYLAPHGYHRSIFVSLSAVDFISVPTHKYREGELESAAEELGEMGGDNRVNDVIS